ncbi:MAG: MgtC/SapB family protein, partial [Planctomycetes bacterium]|nr:MgtC/SapB family protein [Planctomycetota bacterium]
VGVTRPLSYAGTDRSRSGGQVITGIGFLRAGVMLNKAGSLVGVTSAASIWMLAALGVIIGMGYNLLGVKIAVLTVGILVGVNLLEGSFDFMRRGVHSKLGKRRDRPGKSRTEDSQ